LYLVYVISLVSDKFLILVTFFESVLKENLFESLIAAIVNRSKSFFVLPYHTIVVQQINNDLFVAILGRKVQSSVSISIVIILQYLIFDQHLHYLYVSPESCNMKSISVVYILCIYVCVVLTKQLNDIIVALVACIVHRRPVIQTFVIYFNRVTILTMLYELFSLVIMTILAVKSQFLIIFLYIDPKVFPVVLKVMYIYIISSLPFLPCDNFCTRISSYS